LLEEGIEKGIEKGIESLVLRMSAKGRKPAEIADLTDLPVEQIARILKERAL
jgi:predicted transposase YdaD